MSPDDIRNGGGEHFNPHAPTRNPDTTQTFEPTMSDQHDHLALTPEVKPPPLEAVEKVDYNDVSDFAEIPELERGIVRKVDMRILPPLWVMYWLNCAFMRPETSKLTHHRS
jgi:hypothetical protein